MLNLFAASNWVKWALKMKDLSNFHMMYRSPPLRDAAPPCATSSAGCCWLPPRRPFVRRRSLSAQCTRAARRVVRRLARAPSFSLPIPRLKIPASKPKLEREKPEQNRDFKRKLPSQNFWICTKFEP